MRHISAFYFAAQQQTSAVSSDLRLNIYFKCQLQLYNLYINWKSPIVFILVKYLYWNRRLAIKIFLPSNLKKKSNQFPA